MKARQHKIQADGPGALVHIDAKRYGALQGGTLIVGITVVDNFSGFVHLYLCPDGRKTGQNTVTALTEFNDLFPADIKKIYSDNGSEFVNASVIGWAEQNDIKFRTTKPKHAWSNGKAERTQSLLKREVVIPALVDAKNEGRLFENIDQLQNAIDLRLHWFNSIRINGGRNNRGLPPFVVASKCAGLDADQREEMIAELVKEELANNRSFWQGGRE